MFDLILAQMGIKPDELKHTVETVAGNIEAAKRYAQASDARLARIEKHLGIEPPALEGPENVG